MEAGRIFSINPLDNRPYKSRILAQPFGSRRAPANWGRVVTFLQFSARVLPSLVVGAYAGDVFLRREQLPRTIGFLAFKRLFSLLGFNTSDRKNKHPSAAMRIRCRCRIDGKRNSYSRNGRNGTRITRPHCPGITQTSLLPLRKVRSGGDLDLPLCY